MESLLANYGSDDEEEESELKCISLPPPKSQYPSSDGHPRRSSLFGSLPPPKLASDNTSKPQFGFGEHRNKRKTSDVSENTASRVARDQVTPKEAEGIFHAVNMVSDKGFDGTRRSTAAPPSDGVHGAPGARVSLFRALPPPKNAGSSVVPLTSQKSSGSSLVKRVVELRPSINMALLQQTDDDDIEKPPVKRHATEGATRGKVTGLAAILPKPKNLGSALGSGYTSGHQATLDVGTPGTSLIGSGYASDPQAMLDVGASISSSISSVESVPHAVPASLSLSHQHASETWSSYAHHNGSQESTLGAWEGYDGGAHLQDQREAVQPNATFSDSYLSSCDAQEGAEVQGHFLAPDAYSQGMVAHGSFDTTMPTSRDALAELLMRQKRKGGKNPPVNIVEVKQSDLTASTLREDQLRTTGIAFGPAYKPTSANKNKPTKLHRRKHQIGSLYYDMKQKEMELIERRAKGYMTKAETQAKYGW